MEALSASEEPGVLPVVEGLREVILSRRGADGSSEATATEYLAAAATALESADCFHSSALLRVLATCIPSTPRSVLRATSSKVAHTVLKSLDAAAASEDTAAAERVLCCALEVLGLLLGAQERTPSAWASPSVLRPLRMVLVHYADSRASVRHAAHDAIVRVLKEQRRNEGSGNKSAKSSKSKQPRDAPLIVAEFCASELASSGGADATQRLPRLLQLARAAVPLLPASLSLELCLQVLNQRRTAPAAAAYHVISAAAQPTYRSLGGPELCDLTRALLSSAPPHSDTAASVGFCQAVGSAAAAAAAYADRQTARDLLPDIAVALVSMCESQATVVQRAACAALNLAFQSTVDKAMVDEARSAAAKAAAAKATNERALPRTLRTMASLMQYRYQSAWPIALPLLGRLFLHLRADGLPPLAPLLRGLADLRAALAVSNPIQGAAAAVSAIDEAVGFAVEGCGAERVISAIPLASKSANSAGNGNDKEAGAGAGALRLETGRIWLLSVLCEHAKAAPCDLSYFRHELLPLARVADAAARSGAAGGGGGGGPLAAAAAVRWVIGIWQLLPSWCGNAVDVASSFGALAPLVAKAIQDKRYPELLNATCAGLTVLATSVHSRAAATAGQPTAAAADAEADLQAVANTAPKFLPLLLEVMAGPGGELQKTWAPLSADRLKSAAAAAAALAEISPPAFLTSLCRKIVHRLLQATEPGVAAAGGSAEDANNNNNTMEVDETTTSNDASATAKTAEAAALLDILASISPSLDDSCVGLVYRAAKPLVRSDDNAVLQKHAYRALLALCKSKNAWMAAEDRLKETLELFAGSLLTCHVSARQVRLRCLTMLVEGLPRNSNAAKTAVSSITGEVVLCLKDSNAKARDGAQTLLLALADAATPVFLAKSVVGALGGRTPHMRSAAMLALAALQQKFAHHRSESRDLSYVKITPDLIETSLLLCAESHKEVFRAVLVFLRVAVGGASREILQPLLADIAKAVTITPPPQIRKACRSAVKVVLGKLCRKFGFAAVLEIVPEADVKLVEHMRKTAEREVRLKTVRRAATEALKSSRSAAANSAAAAESAATRAKMLRAFDPARGADDSESDGELTEAAVTGGHALNANNKNTKQNHNKNHNKNSGNVRVRERLNGGDTVVDLLEGGMMERLGVNEEEERDSELDSDDDGSDFEVGNDGRLIIPDVDSDDASSEDSQDDQNQADDSDSDGDSEENDNGKRVVGNKRSRNGGKEQEQQQQRAANEEAGILHVAKRRRNESGAAVATAKAAASSAKGNQWAAQAAGAQKQRNPKKAAVPGAQYKAKKAGGDVWKKGQKFEPYAYIPLDGRALNTKKGGKGKRGGGAALQQYASVVRTGHGGGDTTKNTKQGSGKGRRR